MDAQIRLSGNSAQMLLGDLRARLSREDALPSRISAAQPVIPPGQMGAGAEVLIGAHGGGAAPAASLAASR